MYEAMSLPPPIQDIRNNIPFSIIARLAADHDPNINDQRAVMQNITEELGIYLNATLISYQAPNFIIHVEDPVTQVQILANPVLNLEHSSLEMVPWSKEHEWAQIPWITAHSRRIDINPLKILPVTSSRGKKKGIARLNDTFALRIPCGYELKAPDYSYLIIAELKDLYNNRFSIFSQCQKISEEIISMKKQLYTVVEELGSSVCNCLHHIDAALTIKPDNLGFLDAVRQALLSASGKNKEYNGVPMPEPLNGYKYEPLQLDAFTNAPMHSQVPLPKTYTTRLKVIYEEAVKQIYMTEPIIETIKKEDGRFHTFITIGSNTHTYHGGSKKSVVEQEAAAIYYDLKRITHILGYSIVDLNYPTLKALIEHIDTWNAQINVLHFQAAFAATEIEEMLEELSHLHIFHSNRCRCLQYKTEEMLKIAKNYLNNMMEKGYEFINLKVQYYSTWEKSDSLVRRHRWWSRSERPSNIATSST